MRTRVVFQARLGCKRRERARGAHAAVAPAGRDRCGHGRYLEHRGDAEVASQFALQGRAHPRPLVFPWRRRQCAVCFDRPGVPGARCGTPLRAGPLKASEVRARPALCQHGAHAATRAGTIRTVLACEHTRDVEHRTSGAAFARQASTDSQPRHGASDGVPPGTAGPAEEPALRLLEHSLPFVKTLARRFAVRRGTGRLLTPVLAQGWTDDALRAGALSAGLSPASIGVLRAAPSAAALSASLRTC